MKFFRGRLVILVCALLLMMLLVPTTSLAQYNSAYNSKYREWMKIIVNYIITGPGDYKITYSHVDAINYSAWHYFDVYLYIYSDYPSAQWYEKLGTVSFRMAPWSEPRKASWDGHVPSSWYWNRAGYDIGIAYADVDSEWYKTGRITMDWNVQVGLP